MKNLFLALVTAGALSLVATPVFACDGHKKAESDETTTTSTTDDASRSKCEGDGKCDKKDKAKKKAKAESGDNQTPAS